jgi:hypothetical protein
MPADREFALPGSGFRPRGFARRYGLTGFWRWWTHELAALVPAGPRAAVARRRMRPVLAFDTHGHACEVFAVTLHSFAFGKHRAPAADLGGKVAAQHRRARVS